jgi:hypothetical protein
LVFILFASLVFLLLRLLLLLLLITTLFDESDTTTEAIRENIETHIMSQQGIVQSLPSPPPEQYGGDDDETNLPAVTKIIRSSYHHHHQHHHHVHTHPGPTIAYPDLPSLPQYSSVPITAAAPTDDDLVRGIGAGAGVVQSRSHHGLFSSSPNVNNNPTKKRVEFSNTLTSIDIQGKTTTSLSMDDVSSLVSSTTTLATTTTTQRQPAESNVNNNNNNNNGTNSNNNNNNNNNNTPPTTMWDNFDAGTRRKYEHIVFSISQLVSCLRVFWNALILLFLYFFFCFFV